MAGNYVDLEVKDDDRGVNWCCLTGRTPVPNTHTCFRTLTTTLLTVGLVVMLIGYLVPRDYRFDPSLPARQMEAREIYYARLSLRLDLCIVVGMGMITLCGVVVAAMATYSLWREVKDGEVYRRTDRFDLDLLAADSGRMMSYGTTAGGVSR